MEVLDREVAAGAFWDDSRTSEMSLQSISLHSLLRALVSAAVCEKILECDFEERMFANSLLRETMLSHLSTQGMRSLAMKI